MRHLAVTLQPHKAKKVNNKSNPPKTALLRLEKERLTAAGG